MKTFSKQLKVMITLVTSVVCLMALKAPGYDENGQDINECLEAPCPEGYTCLNLPGSYLCEAPDGEIIGGSTTGGYDVEHYACSFSGTVDAAGYVSVFGIKKFVGLKAGSDLYVSYKNAGMDCKINGHYLCRLTTCLDFWKAIRE